jgi:hypothetical protein
MYVLTALMGVSDLADRPSGQDCRMWSYNIIELSNAARSVVGEKY